MNKKPRDFERDAEHDYTYGFRCPYCHKGKMRNFAATKSHRYTTVTYQCKTCYRLMDIMYKTSTYERIIENAINRT